jgi:hypothetical protein
MTLQNNIIHQADQLEALRHRVYYRIPRADTKRVFDVLAYLFVHDVVALNT